jgi:hypothetical protein
VEAGVTAIAITGGHIDWVAHADNRPTLWLTIEGWPEDMRYEKIPITEFPIGYGALRISLRQTGYVYFAEAEGACSWYSYSRPGDGFGGRTFKLRMVDGTTENLIGPWASSAATVNKLGRGPVIDVTATGNPPLMSALLVSVAAEAMPRVTVPDYLPPEWMQATAVRFPAGTVAALRRVERKDGDIYEPFALLPDGSSWFKPDRHAAAKEPS